MKRVIIESPYKGDIERNLRYAREAMRDSITWGESPFASHLLYPQVLDDNDPAERKLGMEMGWDWMRSVDKIIVYHDLGVSPGMQEGINRAASMGIQILYRSVKGY